jgi:hypothetical protein
MTFSNRSTPMKSKLIFHLLALLTPHILELTQNFEGRFSLSSRVAGMLYTSHPSLRFLNFLCPAYLATRSLDSLRQCYDSSPLFLCSSIIERDDWCWVDLGVVLMGPIISEWLSRNCVTLIFLGEPSRGGGIAGFLGFSFSLYFSVFTVL